MPVPTDLINACHHFDNIIEPQRRQHRCVNPEEGPRWKMKLLDTVVDSNFHKLEENIRKRL